MRAMILAAGRGARMGSLTQNTPKPLLKVAGRYLIEYSLLSLAKIGVREVVINLCYYRELIKEVLGNGSRYGVTIHYSEEEIALETGGGIFQALPLLGKEPFIVLSCDVISQFPLETLPSVPQGLAHIVLVDNPSYHPRGDFGLEKNAVTQASPLFTFSNISVLRPELFSNCQPGIFRMGDLLREAVGKGQVTGEHYQGLWFNLGTPEELNKAAAAFAYVNHIA